MVEQNKRVLTIERPDTHAVVDFLGHNVAVELTIEDGKLRVVAKCNHGEEGSTWDLHEAEWDLPCVCKKCGADVEEHDTLCAECGNDLCDEGEGA